MAQKYETKHNTEFQILDDENGLWTMDFDGALGKYGASIKIWIHSPLHQLGKVPKSVIFFSYKLDLDFSNNEAEYEALIIGLKL